MGELRIVPAGERAVVAEYGNLIDEKINDQVHALAGKLSGQPGIEELVPTFRSLLIYYDPLKKPYEELCDMILCADREKKKDQEKIGCRLRIPCCYGSHFGPDLADMEKHTGLTREEIIRIHSTTEYKVYMLGFLPGFVYLGGLDERLYMPRLSTPRVKIPKGAVGIGGSQTGVYPLDSPGGWRLIGSTPVDFYDPNRENPVLCKAGDVIRFEPVTSCDYYDIRQEILQGRYEIPVENYAVVPE